MPKVGIVISNYNGWQDTLVCLDSLQKQTYKDFEIILLDDASPNDSVAPTRCFCRKSRTWALPPSTMWVCAVHWPMAATMCCC